jgi:tetratricopeptide (TPR) repeat protein
MMYNRKRIIMIVAFAVMSIGVHAQSALDNGIKMYKYNKFQTAESILSPLAATDPQANYYLGLCQLESGDAATASTTFQKYPEDPANISGTARVAFVNKDATKGMQIAKTLAAKSKKKEWIQEKYAADAIAYTDGGDYHQAVAWYADVFTKADDADAHIGAGDAYRKIPGGGGEAMNNYEHVTEKDPKNSLAFTHIGDLWYEAHNYTSALDNYGKAKDADPSNPLPYKSLANAYAYSGKYQQALENLKKYLELSDKTFNDKLGYAEALYLAQSNCDAVQYSKDLLQSGQLQGGKKTEVIGILGFSEALCGDSVDALKNLRSYFAMNTKKIAPQAYIDFGKLFMKLDMLDSAGYYYAKGISGDTAQNKTDIYRSIAEAFKAKKQYCKAAEWYDNLIKANPSTQPGDYAWRAIMFFYCPDLAKGQQAANDFAAKYPDQPTAYYWQGRTQQLIDSEATTGLAVPAFIKWLDMVGPSYPKKNDMKGAYEYLLYYYYNKKDNDNVKMYKEKIMAIDPDDNVLKQVNEMEKGATAPKKPAPAKGKK